MGVVDVPAISLLFPLAIITLPLWWMAIRRERRLVREVALLLRIPVNTSNSVIRRQVGEKLRDGNIAKDSWGPAVVGLVVIAVAVFVSFQAL